MKTDREKTAYHEAGHAVSALIKRVGFQYVTIVPDEGEDARGYIRYHRALDETNFDALSSERAYAYIFITLAGYYAENKFSGEYNDEGATSDFEKAARLAFKASARPQEVIDRATKQVRAFFDKPLYWHFTERIAAGLLHHETLTKQQVEEYKNSI